MREKEKIQKEALEQLSREVNEEHLWECIVAFQEYPFETVSGLPFCYRLKTGRNGQPTRELWVDRRENSKSIAWSSIKLVFESVLTLQKQQNTEGAVIINRPKALGDIRGVSYICPLFIKFGLVEVVSGRRKHRTL